MNDVSFDEFVAISERDRAKKANLKEKQAELDKATAKPSSAGKDKERNVGWGIGELLEMHQMQAFVILMIILDTFASFGETLIISITDVDLDVPPTAEGIDSGNNGEWMIYIAKLLLYALSPQLLLKLLIAFTGFTLIFFGVELVAVFVVFRNTVAGQWGYLLDSIVVGFQLYCHILGRNKLTRLLNIFRLWRLVRLFNSLINIEKDDHERTRRIVIEKDTNTRRLESEAMHLEQELIKEKEARESVDEMLQSYKEEVETLNEALKIAAMDIAEVAQADDDLFLSEEEDEDVDGDFEEEEGDNYDDDLDEGGGGGGSEAVTGAGNLNSSTAGSSSSSSSSSRNARVDRLVGGEGRGGSRGPASTTGSSASSGRRKAGGRGDDDSAFSDASASQFDRDKGRNREALLREARKDSGGGSGGGGGGSSSSSNISSTLANAAAAKRAQGGVTFLVHSDGSFEHR